MRSSVVGAVLTVLAVAAVPAALLAAPLEALPYLSLVVVLGLPLYFAACSRSSDARRTGWKTCPRRVLSTPRQTPQKPVGMPQAVPAQQE